MWPDHQARRRRLQAAITLARTETPKVIKGDLLDDLPRLLAGVPDEAQLVVFHSAVLCYVSAERRQEFARVLANESKRREVVWLSNEAPGVIPEISALAPEQKVLRFLLGRTRFTKGNRGDELLAISHPHGLDAIWI